MKFKVGTAVVFTLLITLGRCMEDAPLQEPGQEPDVDRRLADTRRTMDELGQQFLKVWNERKAVYQAQLPHEQATLEVFENAAKNLVGLMKVLNAKLGAKGGDVAARSSSPSQPQAATGRAQLQGPDRADKERSLQQAKKLFDVATGKTIHESIYITWRDSNNEPHTDDELRCLDPNLYIQNYYRSNRVHKVALKNVGSSRPLRLEIAFYDSESNQTPEGVLYKPSSDYANGWVVEQEGKHAFTDGRVLIDYPEDPEE